MQIVRYILLVLLGLSYLFSGYTKLLPIEYFENDILKSGLAGEYSVLFLSRLIIGSEFLIGMLFLLRLLLKPALKVSLWMLLFYTLYLGYVIFRFGNEGNCGCYGHTYTMTPLQGIIKNFLIAGVTFFLLKSEIFKPIDSKRRIMAYIVGVLSVASPFVLYKIDFPEKVIIEGQEKQKINLDALYSTEGIAPPPFDLRSGKKIIAFLSLTCSKCKMAANKLEVIKRQNPDLPIYFIINGEGEDFPEFLRVTQMENTPYAFFNDGDALIKICGVRFPAIFLVNDSYADASLSYLELSAENLSEWAGR